MSEIVIFPGQGAQLVGMGKEVSEAYPYAKSMVEEANDILDFNIGGLCFEGPEEKLNSTENCQVAIFLVSAIFFEIVKRERGWSDISATAGLSLGEYSALYAAGSISFKDCIRLVRRRGCLMQEAGQRSPGTMASLLGATEEDARALCESVDGYVVPANINCPGQVVISGEIDAVKQACENSKEKKLRAIELKVSGAFHSELMDYAAAGLAETLADVEIKPPSITLFTNVTGEKVVEPDEIRKGLVKQLKQPVLWQLCMENIIKEHQGTFVELGPNKVLAGLMRKIDRSQTVSTLNSLDSVKAFIS